MGDGTSAVFEKVGLFLSSSKTLHLTSTVIYFCWAVSDGVRVSVAVKHALKQSSWLQCASSMRLRRRSEHSARLRRSAVLKNEDAWRMKEVKDKKRDEKLENEVSGGTVGTSVHEWEQRRAISWMSWVWRIVVRIAYDERRWFSNLLIFLRVGSDSVVTYIYFARVVRVHLVWQRARRFYAFNHISS